MNADKTGTIRVADSELYYEIYGSGRPLILIHGAWTDRRIWGPQLEALSEDYKIIAYDLRGHGRSTVGELPYDHVADLTTLMDRLGIEQATILGHDLGGAVARAMAMEKFDRVDSLILASAGNQGLFGVPMPDEELKLYGRPLQAAHEGDYESAINLHERIWIEGVDHQTDPEIKSAIRAILEDHTFAGAKPDAPEVLWSTHTFQDLHLIHLPVLITWGLNDQPLIERTSLKTADVLHDVHTGSIPDAAHYVHWEQTEEFNRMVLEFLEG